MRLKNDIRIKTQLILFILLSLLLTLLIQWIYYVSYSRNMNRKISEYSSSLADQIENRFRSDANRLISTGQRISYNTNVQKYMLNDDYDFRRMINPVMINLFDFTVSAATDIKFMMFINTEGQIIFSDSTQQLTYYNLLSQMRKDYIDQQPHGNQPIITRLYGSGSTLLYAYIIPSFSTQPDNQYGQFIGATLIVQDAATIQIVDENEAARTPYYFLLYDQNKEILSTNFDKEMAFITDATQTDGYQVYDIKGKQYVLTQKEFSMPRWTLYLAVPTSEILRNEPNTAWIFLMINIVFAAILGLFGYLIHRNIMNPVVSIVNEMNEIGKGQAGGEISYQSNNEIGLLSDHVNKMISRLNDMTKTTLAAQEKMYHLEILSKEAEIIMLQSQINPHFLYNTLECMRSMALENEDVTLAEMCTALSRTFRYSITKEKITTIEDELNLVRSYFKIIDIRFDHRIKLVIICDETALKRPIIKMILQPLVENAVYHGLELKSGPGLIQLKITCEHDQLAIMVQDDGVGLEQEQIRTIMDNAHENESDDQQTGIGLINIMQRLRLFTDNRYHFEIESQKGSGTRVMISLGCAVSQTDSIWQEK